jgi:3-phenylpropionate/trans-cinnamate dioxygenase ferredoxin subunit
MTGFSRACAVAEIPDGGVKAVDVEGLEVALIRAGDEVYAIRDECSHAQIALSEGDVEGLEIECWLHGSRFDVRTGEVLNLPATEPVAVYPCKIDGDDVVVDVDNPLFP